MYIVYKLKEKRQFSSLVYPQGVQWAPVTESRGAKFKNTKKRDIEIFGVF